MLAWVRQRVPGVVVFGVAAALAFGAPAIASADPGDIGVQGPSFVGANGGVPPSGSKPESKLWFNDGSWWGVLFDSGSGDFHIFRFNAGPQTWTDTGVPVDTRNNSVADALWDGSKLYVSSHVYDESPGSGVPGNLYRYSYAGGTYTLDPGFPVQINNFSTETLVIARDTTGQLWATWTQGNAVWVNRTVCSPACSDTTWGTPFTLATGLAADDISSVIAFGGKVGVMWSNQAADLMRFAVHTDSDPSDTAFAAETASSGSNEADDHINLKTDGSRVFAAVKTSLSGSSPLTKLLVRTPGGAWVQHVFGLGSDNHTRPIVLLDEANGFIRMFATSGQSGGTIYEKDLALSSADTSGVNFASGLGTPRIRDADQLKMNNATSTKDNPDASTNVLVLATNKPTTFYWSAYLAFGPDGTPPVLQSAAIDGAALTLTYNEALNAGSVPGAGAFTPKVGGVARSVTDVAIQGSTVALTVSPAVVAGDIVTLDYAVPGTNPIEDVVGNDAAGFTDRAVTNSTSGGGGGSLSLLPNADVSHDAVIKDRSGGTTNLFASIDDTIAGADNGTTYVRNDSKTSGAYVAQLTDTPSGFTSMQSLTIDIRARTTNRVDDNTTLFAQVFRADGTTPLTNEIAVATNPGTSGFQTISGVSFTGVAAADKAAWDGARLRLRWAYTQVGTADSTQLRLTAVELHATSGGGSDLTPPSFQSAQVNGSSLTLTYDESLNPGSQPAASAFTAEVNTVTRSLTVTGISGAVVTLTLASPVVSTDTVTIAYTKPGSAPLEDLAGNDAANLPDTAVTNNTPASDLTPPSFQSAQVNGSSLTLTYDESLNPGSQPAASAFTAEVNAVTRSLTVTGISGAVVTLTLASPVVATDTVTIAYTKPGTNPLEDLAGNDAANLPDTAATNNTPGGGGGPLTFLPDGDGARDAVIRDQGGGTVDLWDRIDDTIAAADNGTTYVRNDNKQSGSYFATLSNTPAGFGQMQSLTIDIRARTTGAVDDQTTLFAQVFAADGTTPLTNEVSVATNPGPSAWQTVSGVSFTGVAGADKATWDGAQVRLRWAYTPVGAQDTTQLRLTAVELDGTF